MALDPVMIQEMISIVKSVIPGWSGFSYPRFEEEEVNYKKAGMTKAQDLLNEAELYRLVIKENNYDEVINRLEKVAQSTNLLFLGAPKSGDLSILYQEKLDQESFFNQVYDLLHGEGSSPERLERYIDYVQANELANKWTFPTYFLFMCLPHSEMFVKPTAMKKFLEMLGMQDKWSSKPSQLTYSTILNLADELKVALKDYGPRDMVDIQSFIWIVTKPGLTHLLTKEKKKEFSRLFQEFTQTYLPSKQGQQHIAYYQTGRVQARQNLDEITRAVEQGQDVTDAVLVKLLPHSNTRGNRDKGAWIHVAPSVTKDIKVWFQNAGWTKPADWPKISEAILNFVQHCLEDPSQISEACEDFSILPYSKGFQTGMLSPILNALRPDDFVLVNNKSRQVLNYFTGNDFGQNLRDYPETNKTAQSLIKELQEELRKPGSPDIHDTDLFDMFSHWLIGVKRYFRKTILELAPPFSEMFADSQEAEWAFDLLKETAERLGVHGPDDEMAAFTLRKRSKEYLLRMSYGNWLVLGFAGHSKSLKAIEIPLFTQAPDFKAYWSGNFKQPKNEQDVTLYSVPFESIISFDENLRPIFEETIDFISGRFSGWRRSNIRNRANPQVTEAVFDLEKRAQLLRLGVAPMESSVEEEDEETEIEKGGNGDGEYEPQFWKIAPEAGGRLWSHWSDEGYISIGWDEFGDLSGVTRDDFEARRDELIALHSNWTVEGCEQVWKFVNIREGDRIIANRGTSQVLGLGTVTGHYYFVEDVEHGHRIPVRWDDTTLRIISEPGWRRSLIKLTKEKFERIRGLPGGEVKKNPEYSLADCAKDTGFDISIITSWVKAIERKGQAILYGPPGTGKTFMAELLAQHLIGGGDGFVETVQFHPAYAYEDFIQGIRPRTRPDGGLEYPLVPGRFLKFCARASERSGRCVLIIDEINRANLSRVFGELMYLLEYRDKFITLAGGEWFTIPSNVRLIGTMNTADRSIALVDHALRRRFAFLELYPEMDVLRQYHKTTGFPVDGLIDVLDRLNQRIDNPHYAVGISYFLLGDLASQIEDIWKMEIEPYLNEYFFDHPEWAREFAWAKVRASIMP